MNKTFSTAIFAVLFSIFILFTSTAQANLILTTSPITLYQDNSKSGSFVIVSDVDTTASFVVSGLPTGVSMNPNPIPNAVLTANIPKTINFTLNAQNDADIGKKTITINATDLTANSTSSSFTLDVRRNFCEIGPEGDDISVKIRDPDSNNNFDAGDTISIEIRVYSDDEDRKSVV